jgi:hypothetical protein
MCLKIITSSPSFSMKHSISCIISCIEMVHGSYPLKMSVYIQYSHETLGKDSSINGGMSVTHRNNCSVVNTFRCTGLLLHKYELNQNTEHSIKRNRMN